MQMSSMPTTDGLPWLTITRKIWAGTTLQHLNWPMAPEKMDMVDLRSSFSFLASDAYCLLSPWTQYDETIWRWRGRRSIDRGWFDEVCEVSIMRSINSLCALLVSQNVGLVQRYHNKINRRWRGRSLVVCLDAAEACLFQPHCFFVVTLALPNQLPRPGSHIPILYFVQQSESSFSSQITNWHIVTCLENPFKCYLLTANVSGRHEMWKTRSPPSGHPMLPLSRRCQL